MSQLDDNGAVIGYKPKLEYKKEKNQTSEVGTGNNASTDHSGSVTYSDTLSGFENNLPSTSIKDIDYVIQNIRLLIDKLSKDFHDGEWNEYNDISSLLSAVESDDVDYIKKFIDYHKDSINGSIVPELIGRMYDTQTRLKALYETLKELYYGDPNISLEETQEIDAGYIEQLKKYEQSGETGKINYIALSYDSILNRSVTMYAYNINRKCIGLSKVTQSETDISTDSSKVPLIERLFTEVNDDLNYRSNSYEVQQSIEIMKKTLYNYYDKRLNLLEMYDMFGGGESFPLMNRVYEYQAKADKAIENVARTFVANQYHIAEITGLEQEKYDLMQNYSKLNYNS
jgi:hypothetical protein